MIDVPKRDIGAKIPGHFGERECVGYCFIQLVDGIVLSFKWKGGSLHQVQTGSTLMTRNTLTEN